MNTPCGHENKGITFFDGAKFKTCDSCMFKLMSAIGEKLGAEGIDISFTKGHYSANHHNLPQSHVDGITEWVADLESRHLHAGGLGAAILAAFKAEGVESCSNEFLELFIDGLLFRTIVHSIHCRFAHALIFGREFYGNFHYTTTPSTDENKTTIVMKQYKCSKCTLTSHVVSDVNTHEAACNARCKHVLSDVDEHEDAPKKCKHD
jgi:hypothetical protein